MKQQRNCHGHFILLTKQFADYTALNQLPKVKLDYDYQFGKDNGQGDVRLKIKNPTGTIAFFVFLDLVDPETSEPVLPVFWSDNYVTLLPDEERTYTAGYFLRNTGSEKPLIKVQGWNVDPVTCK